LECQNIGFWPISWLGRGAFACQIDCT
jgi:hypothetical protein